MEKQNPFQTMFDSILSYLKEVNTVVEFSNNFYSNQGLFHKFMYLWKSETVQKYINIHIKKADKNDKKAEGFRKEGNLYYKNRNFYKALEFYNKSLIYSTHTCDGGENSPGYKSTTLALAYANRSAVLYEIGNYKECISDIGKSFSYGYPSLLKPKLIERHIKCLVVLHKKNDARKLLNIYIDEVKNMKEDESLLLQKELQKLELALFQCDNGNFAQQNDSAVLKGKMLSRVDSPILPELPTKSSTIPSLSGSVAVSYSESKGRYLVATNDIYPGDILVKEKAYESILLPTTLLSHCSLCLKRTFTPVPCQTCSFVVFCSEECRVESTTNFHRVECDILPTLVDLEIGKNNILALRLIVQMPLPELKDSVSEYEKERLERKASSLGFNPSKMYCSDDLRTIYHLVTNQESRSVGDIFKRGVIAICLLKLLIETNYFGELLDHIDESDITLVGATLFRLAMALPCNAHSITELCIDSSNNQKSGVEEVGAGAFGVLSLANHSCDPNMFRSSYGTIIIGRAIRFIPEGDEITDCYGQHFALQNIHDRLSELKSQYYFSCTCEACCGRWLSYDLLAKDRAIKCPECYSRVEIMTDNCPYCCTAGGLKAIYEKFQEAISEFDSLFLSISKGELGHETEDRLLGIIHTLSMYSIPPNKTLLEAQEMLKFLYSKNGSHYYI